MGHWARLSLRHPRLTLALVAVVTLAAALPCLGLRTDNTIAAWLPAGDAELQRYERFRQAFGEDNFVLVAVEGVAFDDADDLVAMEELGAALAAAGDVLGPAGDPARPWLDVSMLRSEERGAAGWLVSPVGEQDPAAFTGAVEQALARARLGAGAAVAGPLAINQALDQASQAAFAGLFPLVAAIMLVTLWLVLRHVGLVLSILLVTVVASTWTLGLLAASGHTLNMVSAPLPALLLVLGMAYALHLVCAARASEEADERARWSHAVDATLRPSTLTALTTAAGLAALGLAPLPPVQQLGCFGAAGVLIDYVLVFTLLPALQLTLGARLGPAWGPPAAASRLVDGALRRRPLVLGAACAVALVAAVGLSRLVMASDVLSYFPDDHALPRSTASIERSLTGLTPIEVWISGDAEQLLSEDGVDGLKETAQACRALPAVTGVFGLFCSDAGLGALPTGLALPLLRRLHASGELAAAGRDRVRADGDGLELRWTVASRTTAIEDSAVLAQRVAEVLEAQLPDGLHATLTGAVALLVRVQALLLVTQVQTFGLSLLAVTLVLALAFRSLRLALLSLVPNLLPVLMTLGVMGFAGIPLNVATVTVAGIAYGLVVDDTVHILSRLARRPGGRVPASPSLAHAVAATARPVIASSAVTACGFSAFALASFRPTAWFGLLIALTAVCALLCDLVLLPAVMERRA